MTHLGFSIMLEIDAGVECDCVLEIDNDDALDPNQGRKRFRDVSTEGSLSLHCIIGERGAWGVPVFFPQPLTLAVEALRAAPGQVEDHADCRLPKHAWIVGGISALSATSPWARRGSADVRRVRGLLVQETEIARLCVAMTVAEACSRQWKSMMWGLVGLIQPWDKSFRANRRHCEGFRASLCRGCAGVTSKFCVKQIQDAVAVRTSAFYAVSCFGRVPSQRKCLD